MFNKNKLLNEINKKGWSRYKLSKESGVAQTTLRDIFGEKQVTPSTRTLEKISSTLGVPINAFFDDDNKTEIIVDTNKKTIEKDFPIIPEEFINPDEARAYVMKHQIFAYGGFYPERMSDEDILNFANEMIQQAELIRYKYESKKKNK